MQDKPQPHPQPPAPLLTHETVHGMIFAFLPECDTHEHIPYIDETDPDYGTTVSYVMFVDVDVGEFV